MKMLNTQLTILLAAIALAGVGCSKSSGGSDNQIVPQQVDPGVVDSPLVVGAGGSLVSYNNSFTPVSIAEMNSYVGSYALNSPSNYKVSVELTNVGKSKFGGTVRLSYYDVNSYGQSVYHEGVFKSCFSSDCKNPNFSSDGTAKDVGDSEAKYNYWFSKGGKKVFSGFFQDTYGSVVLIVDDVVNLGDGQGGGIVSGQIWYRNFAQTFAYQSNLRTCWFIYAGPFDCRSSIVMKKNQLYPSDSYRKLGDFTGVTFSPK